MSNLPPSDPWSNPSSPPPPPSPGGSFGAPPPPPSSGGFPTTPPQAGPGTWGQAPAGYQGYEQPVAGTYASWGQRVGATLLDGLMALVGYIPAAIFVAAEVAVLAVLFYIAAVGLALYFAYLTGATGQSPGKRLMGIKVVNEATGQPIGGGMGIARTFVHIIDGLPCYLGYLWPLWDQKRQTFTDKVLGTVVHSGARKYSFGAELFKK